MVPPAGFEPAPDNRAGRDALRVELVRGVEDDADVCATWDAYLDSLGAYAARVPCYATGDDSIVTEYGRGAGAAAARQHGLFLTHDQVETLGDDEVDALRAALGARAVSYTHLTLPTKRIV